MTDDAADTFDPSPYAIPVAYMSGETFTMGSAFLGRLNGVTSFYTAAHNMYGFNPVATFQWDGWYQRIGVYLEPGQPAKALEAFNVIQPSARYPGVIAGAFPLFSWVPEPGTKYMKDAVRFRQSETTHLLVQCMKKFSVVDLDNLVPISELEAGDLLSSVGYPLPPDFEQTKMWPYSPPERLDGEFLRVTEGHIQATMASRKGFSGGPAFTEAGRFVGMVVGSNPEPGYSYEIARIVPAGDIASL